MKKGLYIAICCVLLLCLVPLKQNENIKMGFSLNPLTDLSQLGNAIGGIFGNNTHPTVTQNWGLPGNFANPSYPLGEPHGTGVIPKGQVLSAPASGGTPANLGGYSTTSPTSTTSALDPAILAQYQQAIANTQSAIDRIPTQQSAAQSGIDSSYQAALKQLLLGKNQAQQSYDTTKQQGAQNYVQTKNTIGSQAGQTLNGLLRLLGSRGAGGGSAYLQAAPQAVARGASLQRANVGQQFGQNSQALDQNWGQYLQGYQGSVDNAGFQKNQQYGALQNSVNTNKASLLQTLAQLTAARDQNVASAQPYLDQANNLLNQTANYAPASFSVNPTPYTPPSAASYTATPQTVSFNGSTPTNDYFSPYLQSLLGKKQLATA